MDLETYLLEHGYGIGLEAPAACPKQHAEGEGLRQDVEQPLLTVRPTLKLQRKDADSKLRLLRKPGH